MDGTVEMCAVVEHLHDPAVSGGVRRTRTEFVVHLLVGHHCCGQTVQTLMCCCYGLRCGQECFVGQDDHVNILQAMQVLIRYGAKNGRMEELVTH